MALLLNEAQAKAVADAMIALNNVGARAHIRLREAGRRLHVQEYLDGEVYVFFGDMAGNCTDAHTLERYRSQNDFFAAYGVA